MSPPLQTAAYMAAVSLSVIAFARRYSRLGWYLVAMFAVDAVREWMQTVRVYDAALLILDGALFLSPFLLLGAALRAEILPLLGLWILPLVFAFLGLRGPRLYDMYIAAHICAQIYLVGVIGWRVITTRRPLDRQSGLFSALLLAGIAEVVLALFWRVWTYVNVCNITLYALLGLACLSREYSEESYE